ncbi:MAG: hypothetical protein ABIR03_14825 [Ginsengibacter sp.]
MECSLIGGRVEGAYQHPGAGDTPKVPGKIKHVYGQEAIWSLLLFTCIC